MLYLNLASMLKIRCEFEKELDNYSYKTIEINATEQIYVVEDSLILLVSFMKDSLPVGSDTEKQFTSYKNHKYLELPSKENTYYNFQIEELTYNEIGFNFNNSDFCRKLENIFNINNMWLDVKYKKFKGYTRLYWCPNEETTAERINRIMPELKLYERYLCWEGVCYNFIIFELTDKEKNKYYAVAYTKNSVTSYVNQIAKRYIRKGVFQAENLQVNYALFTNALSSFKGTKRQKRLECNLKYFYFKKYFREKNDAWRYADKLVNQADNHLFDSLDKTSYVRPENKWTSEELVYKLTKKIFSDYKVIYQHRPFFLKSSNGGQMSYDIFISGMNVAIEYQGKQHFEPVEFFGEEESFKETQRRDKEKKHISQLNNIKLVYINYWEDITTELIKKRVLGED